VRSRRRKRTLQISVDAGGDVRVAVPYRTPVAAIEAFVRERVPWLERQLAAAPPAPERAWVSGERVPYLGRSLALAVTEAPRPAPAALAGGVLRIELPVALTGAPRAAAARVAMEAWYRPRAERLLAARAARWARRLGWAPRRVIVKAQRRRWGSCARDGTIRLNWRLVMAEPALIDYVIVHELAHLEVHHHGPEFWVRVRSVLPGCEVQRRQLRQEGGTFEL